MHVKIVFLVISVIFLQNVIASETQEIVPRNAAHPDRCYVERYGLSLKYGTKVQVPGKCAEMVCNRKRELTISDCEKGYDPLCGSVARPQNRGKPFPDCCPLYFCA